MTKDPRQIKSFPCSPRTQNIASQKWKYNEDEANIDWNQDEPTSRNLINYRKMATMSRKLFFKSIS